MTEARLAERKVGFEYVNELNVVVSVYEDTFIEDIQREIHDASTGVAGFIITLDALKANGLNDMEASMIFSELVKNGIINADGCRNSSIHEFLESHRVLFPVIPDQRFTEIIKVFQDTSGAVRDGRKPRKMVRIRQDKWKEFKELWETINRESRVVYKDVHDDEIIHFARKAFDAASIPKARTIVTKSAYDSEKDEIRKIEERITNDVAYFQKKPLHDNVMNIAREHNWPIRFLLKLFNSIDTAKFKSNPSLAEKRLVDIIQNAVHATVLKKVEYQFAETGVYPNRLQKNNGENVGSLPYTELGRKYDAMSPREEFLYDMVVYDSEIELKSILDDPVAILADGKMIGNITVFAKLPRIDIPTPFKTYNPDFAYVVGNDDGQTLFLVVETKGYDDETKMSDDEQKKIDYGFKFFESLQKTRPENVQVCFHRRLNVDGLSDMVRECYSK